jgi:hypothetical protein
MEEGAILIFAHTAREARNIGWNDCPFETEFIDFATKRIRNENWLYEEADQNKLANGIPHVIDNPKTCLSCGCWGGCPIDDDCLCEPCRDEFLEKYCDGCGV